MYYRPVGRGEKARLLGDFGVQLVLCTVARALFLRDARDLAILLRPQRVGTAHRALPLEHDPFMDDEARGSDVPEELPRGADLEALLRRHVARDPPVDHDGATRDLRIDDGALTDDERVLRRDLALHMPLDAHRPLELQLAGHSAALAEECARTAHLSGLHSLPLEHLRLPGYRTVCGGARLRGKPSGPVDPLPILSE